VEIDHRRGLGGVIRDSRPNWLESALEPDVGLVDAVLQGRFRLDLVEGSHRAFKRQVALGMKRMMRSLQKMHIQVRQVQEFTPTPMTVSTCMYFSGRDFETGKPIHVPKGREVRLMKSLVQWFLPENKDKVAEALRLVRGEKPDRQND
jgi:hypothetical protein